MFELEQVRRQEKGKSGSGSSHVVIQMVVTATELGAETVQAWLRVNGISAAAVHAMDTMSTQGVKAYYVDCTGSTSSLAAIMWGMEAFEDMASTRQKLASGHTAGAAPEEERESYMRRCATAV